MNSRRQFLILGACAASPIAVSAPALAQAQGSSRLQQPKAATAITQVFGDGVRLTAVALEYEAPVKTADLAPTDFRVAGRSVTGVFASRSAKSADRVENGRFVIVTLCAQDANAPLAQRTPAPGQPAPGAQGGMGGPGRGPGNAGDVPVYDTVYRPALASVTAPGGATLTTTRVHNLIVDDFLQLEYRDPGTGRSLRYNLFVPRDYDRRQSYPLVLFMHDAGATSDVTRTTLFQGLGAIAWASPEDQAKRPCFVLAPQFAEIIADDDSRTSSMLDTTIGLIQMLAGKYSIDRKRLYTTGQSGGCMMSIAMDIKYPGFFAASFLVAGQWDAALVRPLARQKLWILISQDDDKAYPGQNAITAALEKEGARISRAVWDGTWTAAQFRVGFEKIDAEASPINYVSFQPGSVIPPGSSAAGASGHRNTWRIAYTIEPIREWIFRQHG